MRARELILVSMMKQLPDSVRSPRRLLISIGVAAAVVGAVLTGVLVPRSADAAGTTVAAVSLSAPAAGTYGTKINLTGVLWKYNTSTKIAGAQVALQRANHGKANWGNLNYAKTSATGAISFSVTQQTAYDYRIYYAGSSVYRAALSAVRYPVVNQNSLFDKMAPYDYWSGEMRASGRVVPAPPVGTGVYLDLWNGKTWGAIAVAKTTAGGNVTVAAIRPAGAATYRLRVPTRAGLGTGASAAKAFTTFRYHGMFSRPYTYTGVSPMTLDVDENDANHSKAEIYGKSPLAPAIEQSFQGCIQAVYEVKNYNPGHGQTVTLVDQNNHELRPAIVLDASTTSTPPSAVATINLTGVTTLKQWYGLTSANTIYLGLSLVLLCSN
jgi:hypothetical protein